jgi:hypothetical protein
MAMGVADARRLYAQAGMPMAAGKNGRVVCVDPVTLEDVPCPGALTPQATSSSD